MKTRMCSRCRVEKQLNAFARRPDRPEGRHYACRQCISRKFRSLENQATPNLSEVDLGYVAAMLDGEGSVCFQRQRKGDKEWYSFQVRISNTHRGMLEWISARLGGSICFSHKPKSPRHKQGYVWVLTTRPAIALLRVLLPQLKIKRRHAEVTIALYTGLWTARDAARDAGIAVGTPALKGQLHLLAEELRLLNRKGPR